MWLPSQIGAKVEDMRRMGFRLRADDLYSATEPALNRAVVMFGRGCTGAIVSADGLLLTNHHCGYGQIVDHSTVEHDYLTNGFWAMSRAEELPNEGLEVRIMVRMENVTEAVEAGLSERIIAEAEQRGRYRGEIKPLYYGNEHWMWVYEVFRDVRLVAAPPSAVGKFGGDTDNWMWPRHTGDFSIFRIYANADNEPADYSPDNVPYRPARHFEIATEGIREGDFTMVYGFPGSTRQYIVSPEVEYIEQRSNPMKITIRTHRLESIRRQMESSPERRIELAARQASIANGGKKWQGESWGLERRGTADRKRIEEERFERWASVRPRYAHLLDSLRAVYGRLEEHIFVSEQLSEVLGSRARSFASDPELARLYKTYMRALREMEPERDFYPDANFTLRISYGRVEGYAAEDGVWHTPFTTLAGVMEKDNPAIYDYDVPERLRELYRNKAFRDVPVCFLASNHTSGGNSGSPVLDGRGRLVGLNFDRTWMGTMSDIEFSNDFCRNISVDIRYVLFITQHLGGARWLVDEMTGNFSPPPPIGGLTTSKKSKKFSTLNSQLSTPRRFAYRGFSGGMMVHTGYLGGGETFNGQNVRGVPTGIGGVARIHLGDHLRVGSEGYVTTLRYGSGDSHARIGWGGVLADWHWQLGRWAPYAGGTVGAQGGAAKSSEGFRDVYEEARSAYSADDAVRQTMESAGIVLTDREKEILRLKALIREIEAVLREVEEGNSELSVEEVQELKAELQRLKEQLYAMQFNLM